MKKRRIMNSEKILSGFLKEGDDFHIGLLYEDFMSSPNLQKFKIPTTFNALVEVIPAPVGSVTKSNVKGKFIRKQPEEKVTKTVEIKYTRKKDGAKIQYKRDFNVYAQVLQHKYNIPLKFETNNHGQKLVVSPLLKFENDTQSVIKNTHVINMFCEIFNDFEVYSNKLEPSLKFNKQFESELLPKGKLTDVENFNDIVEVANRYTRNEKEAVAFIERLNVIQEYSPDILGKGPSGFFGYIVFGFTELDIVILESMYLGNATYVFETKDYESNVILDKQNVIKNNLAKSRFFHHDNWEKNIRRYLTKLKKSKEI
jgi:hypothetical protein